MRVWLVAEQQGESVPPLEPVLREVAERAGGRMALLGCGPLCPGLLAELRGWQLDLLVMREARLVIFSPNDSDEPLVLMLLHDKARATTDTVVTLAITIMISDYFLTKLFILVVS